MVGSHLLGHDEKLGETSQRYIIGAVAVGNALEWFELVVFGYFAAIISDLFFPSSDPTASLLLTLASFGIAYVMRPLGAVVLGTYADRNGRKTALQLSIFLMALGSVAIAAGPTYAMVGILASIVILVARLVQGFSVGGEFGSATAFLMEQSDKRRGYFASWQFASQGLAALMATGFGAAITFLLNPAQVIAWGWRIPFFLGLALVPLGMYMRARLSETNAFQKNRPAKSPAQSVVLEGKVGLFISVGVIVFGTVSVYTILFMPTYAVKVLSLPAPNSFAAGFVTGALQLFLIPLFGALSDRVGRTAVPIAAAILTLFGTYPILNWLCVAPTINKLLAVQAALGIVTAAYLGSLPALMSELFPVSMRSTGLSVSYAFGVAIFGGFAPFIHFWLIVETADPRAPAIYVMAATIISLASLWSARRRGFN